MKKKRWIIIVVAAAIGIAALITVIYLNKTGFSANSKAKNNAASAETNESADFGFIYADRLAGYPETGYSSNSSTIEITYGDGGYIRKTYATGNNNAGKEYSESSEQDINGITVTFKGRDGSVYLASWSDNNFVYTIFLNEKTGGVSAEEMTEYVKATK